MLRWALIFLVISIIAGAMGFSGVASTTRTIAKVLFFIALAIFVLILLAALLLGRMVF
jgi:uncharacterized membrane protein YtjA (UPF0391 family)